MSGATVQAPLRVRVAVAHGAAQHIADTVGIDLLHIKGPALDPEIIWEGREGTDADVLLRPDDSAIFIEALERSGWEIRSHFENSSAFEHSTTLWHDLWGYLDVHRLFPGITLEPDNAFDRLWQDHVTRSIAGIECAVPNRAGQILIVVLHAARGGGSPRSIDDVHTAWDEAHPDSRKEVSALSQELGAEVAFAAATGHLADYRKAREHDLWLVASQGGTRAQEWRARIKAAPSRRAALGLVLRAPLVNVDHLTMVRGHRPSRREVLAEFFARPARGIAETWQARRRRSDGPSS